MKRFFTISMIGRKKMVITVITFERERERERERRTTARTPYLDTQVEEAKKEEEEEEEDERRQSGQDH